MSAWRSNSESCSRQRTANPHSVMDGGDWRTSGNIGCELRLLEGTDGSACNGQAALHVWSLDALRPLMRKGVVIRLLDGKTPRATATLI